MLTLAGDLEGQGRAVSPAGAKSLTLALALALTLPLTLTLTLTLTLALLRSGGNSARLGNLIDLWFVAGSLDATNQTAGRSPFIATSSLAELYRRSPLREDSWDCLKLGNARCTDAASPRGICHEEAGAPEEMCSSRHNPTTLQP